jgi:hypothetical protein
MAVATSRGRRLDAAALAAFLAASILLTWPVAARIGSQVPGDPHDTLYTLYAMSWSYRVLAGTGTLGDANIFAPHRGVLFYGDPLFGLVLLGAPVRLLTKNPVLLFNILFLLSFVLCAGGAYALARRLTGSRPAALLAGLIFAFCPYRFAHIGHLEILYFAWIPLTLLFLHRLFERPSWINALGASLAFVMQVLSCAYYGAFLAIFAAGLAIHEAVRMGFWRKPRLWGRPAAAAALGAALLALYMWPILQVHSRMLLIRARWEVEHYSAQLQHYLAVPPWNRVWGGLLGWLGGVEWQLFPGLTAVALSLWAWSRLKRRASALPLSPPVDHLRIFYTLWNGMNWALVLLVGFLALRPGLSSMVLGIKVTGRRIEDPLTLLILSFVVRLIVDGRCRGRLGRLFRAANPPARYYAAAGALAFLLSFGPTIRVFGRKILPGPYAWVYEWFPGFQGLRAASRFSVLLMLSLAVFSAYAVAGWLKSRPGSRRPWVVAGLAVLIMAEAWSVPLPMTPIPLGPQIPAIYKSVASLPAAAVLVEMPMPSRDDEEWKDAWPVYYSIYHWKKLVNGYSGYAPPAYRIVREAMQGFPSKASFDLLEGLGIGYVLAHVEAMPAERKPVFLRRMTRHRHRAEPLAEAEGSILYRVLPWADAHTAPEPALHPVGDKRLWRGRSRLNRDTIGRAIDGDPETFWTTGYPQQKGDFVEIDLGRVEQFRRVVLRQQSRPLSFPRNFLVEVSMDRLVWRELDFGRNYFPILKAGRVEDFSSYESVVARAPAEARYVRITLSESLLSGRHWAISELDLLDE